MALSQEGTMFANALGAEFRQLEEREHKGRPVRVILLRSKARRSILLEEL